MSRIKVTRNGASVDQDFADTYELILAAISELQELNTVAPTRSRELSLAITELQTGLLWLTQAKVTDGD